ncbi:MAG: hypothetical protein Q7R77_01790 [Candidatus Daviesbacteria bacterium]|nr:hypothetical protein [Candidatus Daviesbacteria bacterium]
MFQNILKNKTTLSLLIITIYSLLAYAPFIPFLGLYGDDWFFTYIGHFYGLNGLLESKVMERPFTGYLHALNYFLLSDNVFLWHIAMLLVSLLGTYILFFTLKKLWPNKLSIVTSITLLFAIYPGFLQLPSSPTYLPITTNLVIWIISLAFTIYAIKAKSKPRLLFFTIFALILQIFSFLFMEYFIGMETLRLALILYILKTRISFKTVRKIFIYWSPYLLTLMIFILWRVVLFKSTREVTNINWVMETYYSNPLWIAKIPLEILYGLVSTIIFAYFIPLIIRIPRIPLEISFLILFLGIISGGLLYFYYKLMEKSAYDRDLNNSIEIKKFGKDLLFIGSISVLGALLPIIISGRLVRLFDAYDRYTLTSIIGVGFIIIGLLFFLKINSSIRKLFIISIIALSVATHLMNGYLYTTNWNKQKNIWWQLYWRAPKIENNAMLIFNFPPLTQKNLFSEIINRVKWYRIYWVDYQIYGPANLFFNYNDLYSHNINGDYLPDKNVVKKIEEKAIDQTDNLYATYIKGFDKNHLRYYQNAAIVTAPGDHSCLWVLDKERQELPDSADMLLKSNIVYSDADKLVQSDKSVIPPLSIFGPEPTRTWCYYFQKASLARQLRDWDKLSQLTEELLGSGFKPNDVNEWLPFIEGFLVLEKYSQAKDLIETASKNQISLDTFNKNICKMLTRLQVNKIEVYCKL